MKKKLLEQSQQEHVDLKKVEQHFFELRKHTLELMTEIKPLHYLFQRQTLKIIKILNSIEKSVKKDAVRFNHRL